MKSTLDAASVLEAAILCTQEPLSMRSILSLFEGELVADSESEARVWIQAVLAEVENRWVGRGLVLNQVAGGWRFQSVPQMAVYLDRLNPERPMKYSRASLETLAIIAYRQPCTRGDIEDIRGVGVSSQIVKQFEDRGWIEVVGYRETVGRPALFATTAQFLQDLGLQALADLPPIDTEFTQSAVPDLGVNASSLSQELPFEQVAMLVEGVSPPLMAKE